MWIRRYFFGVDTAPVSRHKSIACSCEEFELRQERLRKFSREEEKRLPSNFNKFFFSCLAPNLYSALFCLDRGAVRGYSFQS